MYKAVHDKKTLKMKQQLIIRKLCIMYSLLFRALHVYAIPYYAVLYMQSPPPSPHTVAVVVKLTSNEQKSRECRRKEESASPIWCANIPRLLVYSTTYIYE